MQLICQGFLPDPRLHFHCFHRRLSKLRGRAQQQPGRIKMDDAAVEARREKILPGDLLQGITAASHFDLSSCSGGRGLPDIIELFPCP